MSDSTDMLPAFTGAIESRCEELRRQDQTDRIRKMSKPGGAAAMQGLTGTIPRWKAWGMSDDTMPINPWCCVNGDAKASDDGAQIGSSGMIGRDGTRT